MDDAIEPADQRAGFRRATEWRAGVSSRGPKRSRDLRAETRGELRPTSAVSIVESELLNLG